MVFQTLAIAAAAATVAVLPTAQAQIAAAPTSNTFGACEDKLGAGGSQSLQDILDETFTTNFLQGEDSALEPLFAAASPATLELLMGFDVEGEGNTLLMPFNIDRMGNLLAQEFDLNSTAVAMSADDILMAHILPGTITFQVLEEETAATGMYTVESLQGFEWTFGFSMDDGGGFPFIVDDFNVTTEGAIEIQTDIRNEPDCPNVIIGINGFVVTPDLLLTDAPAPAPVASPRTLPPPPPEPVTPDEDPADTSTEAVAEAPSNGAVSLYTGAAAALWAVGAAAAVAATCM